EPQQEGNAHGHKASWHHAEKFTTRPHNTLCGTAAVRGSQSPVSIPGGVILSQPYRWRSCSPSAAPAKLDAEKAEAHVPDLPETALRLLHRTHSLAQPAMSGTGEPSAYRSYREFNSRSRHASPAVKTPGEQRQRQVPPGVPGKFIRA